MTSTDGDGRVIARFEKLDRRKTSDHVCAHIVASLVQGRLRSGDRIDIDKIAEQLGVSRIPVREAVLQLRSDGLIVSEYHRPARVAQLDERAVLEHFELYAVLMGVAMQRLAADPGAAATIERLAETVGRIDATPKTDEETFEARARDFYRVILVASAGPKLRSMIASFRHVLVHAYRNLDTAARAAQADWIHMEFEALRAGDGRRAADLMLENLHHLGSRFVDELRARDVL